MFEHRHNDDTARISFLENEVRRWRNLAQRDPFTGMYNKSYFEKFLNDVVEITKTEKLSCGMILFDLDHFKSINDRYGHQKGDEVLKRVSELVHSIVREDDLLARLGGEEFAVVLISGSEIPEDRLKDIAEKIRVGVAGIQFNEGGENFTVTTSLAVGKIGDGEDHTSFIKRVDRALYKAKEGGRNRFEVAE